MSGTHGLLAPLVDMLQMPLQVKDNDEVVEGVEFFKIPLGQDATLDIEPEAVTSFVNRTKQHIGVLIHVRDELFIFAVYNGKKAAMAAYLVNGKTLHQEVLGDGANVIGFWPEDLDIGSATRLMLPALSKGWLKNKADKEWQDVDLEQLRTAYCPSSNDKTATDNGG